MFYSGYKKSLSILLLIFSITGFYIWGANYLNMRSGKIEITAYCKTPNYFELGKYRSFELCGEVANKAGIGCGCRRTDPPFDTLNKFADVIFDWFR